MQVTDINDMAKAFNEKSKSNLYPSKIVCRIEGTKSAIGNITYKNGEFSAGSQQLSDKSHQAFKKAVNLLKENSANPDFLTAFNILINEGDFYIYPD